MNVGVLRALLEQTVALQLATVDEGLVPRSVRALGVSFDAESGLLSLALSDAQSVAFRAALGRAGRLAVNLTNPVTFQGVQVKGPLVRLEEASVDAVAAVARYRETFLGALESVGFQRAKVAGLFCTGPARWVRMEPREIYNQTPGPGAGALL